MPESNSTGRSAPAGSASLPRTPQYRRYSFEALLRASGLPADVLARQVGMDATQLRRARENGLVESSADKYACRLGLVPWLIWDDWLVELEVECAREGCTNRFVRHPKGMHRRYCSPRCRRRDGERRARLQGLPSAEHKREYRRAYYAENGDYERARQRRYDRARRAA